MVCTLGVVENWETWEEKLFSILQQECSVKYYLKLLAWLQWDSSKRRTPILLSTAHLATLRAPHISNPISVSLYNCLEDLGFHFAWFINQSKLVRIVCFQKNIPPKTIFYETIIRTLFVFCNSASYVTTRKAWLIVLIYFSDAHDLLPWTRHVLLFNSILFFI